MAQNSEPMVRAQLLLRPDQRKRLERLAASEGRTLSDVARRALDAGLDTLEGRSDEALREQQAVLARLDAIRAEVRARYGVYMGDLVAEVRAEREEDMERIWRGQ
ncbi:MAG: hypothetical protein GX657_14495, partial [Chloroflexi bacterium]|nr:hypothetical protein [Chloroflexota bacterium]